MEGELYQSRALENAELSENQCITVGKGIQ